MQFRKISLTAAIIVAIAAATGCAQDDAASFIASAKRHVEKSGIQGRAHRGQERAAEGAGQSGGAPAARHVAARNRRSRGRGNGSSQGDRAAMPPPTRHTRCSRVRSVRRASTRSSPASSGHASSQPRPRAPNWKYRWRWPTSRRATAKRAQPPLKRHSRNSRRTCVRDSCKRKSPDEAVISRPRVASSIRRSRSRRAIWKR